MTLRDTVYKAQASIDAKYAPLIQRGKFLHEQISKSSFPEKRKAGQTNLDLWYDASIYPLDPRTGKRPRFSCLKSLLEFVGDGEDGLFGYVKSLESQGGQSHETRYLVETALLKERVLNLQREISDQQLQVESIPRLEERIASIEADRFLLEERLQALQTEVELERKARLDCEEGLERQNITLIEKHNSVLQSVRVELVKTKATLKRLTEKFKGLRKTPFGYRCQVRQRRDLSTLSQKGGHAKAQKRLLRTIVGPETVRNVQEENASQGRSQRLHGDTASQVESGRIFASLLSKTEVSSLLESPKLSHVGTRMVNHYLEKIGKSMGPENILETCDRNGITHSGYGAIYKNFRGAVKRVGKGIRVDCLPNPHQVSQLRQKLNSKLEDMIGQYYHIENTLVIPPSAKSKSKEPAKIILSARNSFFVDVESVQRTMVKLYGITTSEVEGDPLIFFLKLDEAEIIHGQKLERVSITLMNRALNPAMKPNSAEYFSVQSEREIWPIASFQVAKESHQVLDWVFKQTQIPSLIEAQEDGKKLEVPGVGEFKVQWHMAADMKTLKCMYGLQHGANSRFCCIYCLQERIKPTVTTVAVARDLLVKRGSSWDGGLFSRNHQSKPITGSQSLGCWKPVLKIPMDRVHICTLHAMNRMVEKILHLHFIFLWTIRDKRVQALAIDLMQKVISSTGAHGGNVVIFKNPELSGKSNSVPNKPSLSGANCSKLFKPSTLEGGSDKLWKDVVNSTKNLLDGGDAKRLQLEMWAALDELRQYFSSALTLSDDQRHHFKEKVEHWGRLFIRCFGEQHVTHYMHVIIKHGPWFVEEYGSLSVWSCQGMENSHHAAKAAYHRHTQHSGGISRKSALHQTFEHWYRIIQHRFRNKELKETEVQAPQLNEDMAEALATRRARTFSSSAAAHWAEWRANCTCQGSRFVPNQISEDQQICAADLIDSHCESLAEEPTSTLLSMPTSN